MTFSRMTFSLRCLLLLAALPVLLSAFSFPAQAEHRTLMDADWRIQVASLSALKNTVSLTDWRWIQDDRGRADAAAMTAPTLDTGGAEWHPCKTGENTFRGRSGCSWFRTTLPNLAGPRRALHFESVDDNADVYINGVHLAHHEGWDDPFDAALDSAWKTNGPNVLAVLVQNIAGGGGITGLVTLGNASANADGQTSPTSDDMHWRVVHLPNDYVVAQPFTQGLDVGHGSLPTPAAWYRKSFTLPAADKNRSVWIDFDGVYRDAVVYLNGVKLGEHPSGYTPARFDLTGNPHVHFGGKNDLAVHIAPSRHEGWWYEGGGIYRHVWLNVASPVHVAPWGTFVVSTIPAGQNVANPQSANTAITTTIRNDGGHPVQVRLVSTVTGRNVPATESAASVVTVPAHGTVNVPQAITIMRPHLWSVESPSMYALRTNIIHGGSVADTTMTPFGVRTLRFDPNQGFFLNGKRVEINGVCNHQDFAGVGIAMPDSVMAWRTAKLKEIGCNAFRTSHNMVADEILDDCDRQGMLVMDENRHLGDTYSPKSEPGVKTTDLSDLAELIRRDRNHPSVILWSMGNEEGGLQGTAEGAAVLKAMMAKVHQYDRTRPISTAMNYTTQEGWMTGFATVENVVGVNYYPEMYDWLHPRYPAKMLYGSEIGSNLSVRGVYQGSDGLALVGMGVTGVEDTWKPVASRPFIAGGFVWTGFDYKGEPTPYKWPDINSNFGLLDEAGFPKDYAFYYKAWWMPQTPMVDLFPPWSDPGAAGEKVTVYCYGNTPRVELFLNGQSLGAKDMPKWEHAEWSIPYAPGALTVKGYDASGTTVTAETLHTPGAPAALRLTCSNPVLPADGEEVSMVEVSVVDANGTVVPNADSRVTFRTTNGAQVVGTGNGDPTDHTPDHSAVRSAFHGKVLGIVGATQTPGRCTVTVTTPGLPPAQLILQYFHPDSK